MARTMSPRMWATSASVERQAPGAVVAQLVAGAVGVVGVGRGSLQVAGHDSSERRFGSAERPSCRRQRRVGLGSVELVDDLGEPAFEEERRRRFSCNAAPSKPSPAATSRSTSSRPSVRRPTHRRAAPAPSTWPAVPDRLAATARGPGRAARALPLAPRRLPGPLVQPPDGVVISPASAPHEVVGGPQCRSLRGGERPADVAVQLAPEISGRSWKVLRIRS